MIMVKTNDSRLLPTRAHASDAGADLRSIQDLEIYPGESEMINTGISLKIPQGHTGLIFSRSGQGLMGITLANSVGVIDSDYRGLIKVKLVNRGDSIYKIVAYETKIAQLVIVPVLLPTFIKSTEDDETWSSTVRGVNGFGSTN